MIIMFYIAFIFGGFSLAYLYGRQTKRFLWREYIALLTGPLAGVGGLMYFYGAKPLFVFVAGMIFGPVLEWGMGFWYRKVMGAHLWIYERYPLPGRHTSYLTLPIWGAGVVLLWLIVRVF